MIQLHCTQKLFAKLPVDASGQIRCQRPSYLAANDAPKSPLSGWHANLILLQRRNCVLFVHDMTRFPVLITCLTKPGFANLDSLFQDAFLSTLLKAGATQEQFETAAKYLTPFFCDTDCNRSVQGTMNHMKQDIENLLWYDNLQVTHLSNIRTGIWLADRPCNVKGLKDAIWPLSEMLGLLDHFAKK